MRIAFLDGDNPLAELALKEGKSLRHVDRVGEMGESDDQSSCADQVANGAEDLDFFLGEVGNLLAILQIARVTVENDALDPILDVGGKSAD